MKRILSTRCIIGALVCAAIVAFAVPAYANIGVPMLMLTLPGMFFALIPIIGLESYMIGRYLNLEFSRSLRTAAFANVISTMAGMPVTWFVLVLLQMVTGGGYAYGVDTALKKFLAVTWQAPWLIPYEQELYWMIPAAAITLLVPFFFASWFIEYQTARQMLKDLPASLVQKAVMYANVTSYVLLGLVILVWLTVAKPDG